MSSLALAISMPTKIGSATASEVSAMVTRPCKSRVALRPWRLSGLADAETDGGLRWVAGLSAQEPCRLPSVPDRLRLPSRADLPDLQEPRDKFRMGGPVLRRFARNDGGD